MLLVALAALLAGCGYTRIPEERTDDGLVRVPSRAAGGVYRDPGADFTPYKRIMLEPPTVEFKKDWREQHPDVDDREFTRIRNEAVKLFRDEFTRELVTRGPYEFAEAPAPDVLTVTPRIVDLDILAPDAGQTAGERTFTPGPVKMQVTGEIRDASRNSLLARVIIFAGDERYGFNELRLANRSTNAHEMRISFGKWAMMVHEALNVAKAARPH
ncbi:MAG TPA: DUF3313 family protein [Steroidobacteraceae bacterium]|nr:DUF3313 family protein [Steroidobacteraceae bacterium]